MTNELTIFQNNNLPSTITQTKLPEGVLHNHGCKSCDWKRIGLCPHGFKEEHEALPEGICQERQNYLKGFYRGQNQEPTFTEWEADYIQGKGIEALQTDEQALKLLNDAIEAQMFKLSMEEDEVIRERTERHIAQLNRRLELTKTLWHKQWSAIRNLQELRLNREAPKKIEVTHKQEITIDEFNKMMKRAKQEEHTIDATYEVMEE